MLLTVLLLAGTIALAGGMFGSDDSDAGNDESADADSHEGPVETIEGEEPNLELLDEVVDPATDELGSDVLVISAQSLSVAPTPLEDWTQSEDVARVSGGNDLEITVPEERSGCLVVVEANFEESIVGSEGSYARTTVGSNVYFVPSGQEFPEEYEWSEQGNTFFDSVSFTDDPSDFGDIRMIVRLEGGEFVTDNHSNDIAHDGRFELPELSANLPIYYLTGQ